MVSLAKSRRVTRRDAERVVKAIHAAFPASVQEFADGNYEKLVPITDERFLPQIFENWDGRDFVIIWESGSPYDWTMTFPYGGISEEFGSTVKDVSDMIPSHLHVEAVNNCVLAIYPA